MQILVFNMQIVVFEKNLVITTTCFRFLGRRTYGSSDLILPFVCPLSSLFRSTSDCVVLYNTMISTVIKSSMIGHSRYNYLHCNIFIEGPILMITELIIMQYRSISNIVYHMAKHYLICQLTIQKLSAPFDVVVSYGKHLVRPDMQAGQTTFWGGG